MTRLGLWRGIASSHALLIALALAGCQPNRQAQRSDSESNRADSIAGQKRPIIGFALILDATPGVTYKAYQPLMDHLTAHAPFLFQLRPGQTSDDLMRSVEERMAELAPLDVVSYLEAHRQFGAVPLVKPLNRRGEPLSRTVFFTREGDGLDALEGLAGLKGGTLVLGAHHSALSNLVPRHELLRAGIRPDDLATIEHMSNDEEVVAAVLEGRFDAGAVEDVVVHGREGTRIFHTSETIPSAPLVIRDDLPEWVAQAIRNPLLQLAVSDSTERDVWAEAIRYGFRSAEDSDYEPVREMVEAVGSQCAGSCHESVGLPDMGDMGDMPDIADPTGQ